MPYATVLYWPNIEIIKHGMENLGAAVADYEKEMLPRVIKAIKNGHWFMQKFFGADLSRDFLYAAIS